MSGLTLIYEPDSEVYAQTYGEGAQALPARQILATSKRSEALVRASEVTVIIAKAQDISPELVAAMPRLAWIQALTTGIDP